MLASSATDAGIGCWDLHSGAELLRYRSCSSPSHGLVCVGGRFLASSQLREPSASSGNVLYWSWNKVSYANLVYRGLGDDEAKLFDAMLLRSRTLKAFNLINRKLYSLEKLEF